LGNDRPEIDLGRVAVWNTRDDQSAPTRGEGGVPVKDFGDTPDDRWRDVLLWLFVPSLVGALSLWALLHSWFDLPIAYGWAFVGIDLVMYMVIGWRGRQLLLFGSRLLGRRRGST